MSTRVITLQDLDKDQVFITKENYDSDINKLKKTAIEMAKAPKPTTTA